LVLVWSTHPSLITSDDRSWAVVFPMVLNRVQLMRYPRIRFTVAKHHLTDKCLRIGKTIESVENPFYLSAIKRKDIRKLGTFSG